MYTRAQIIQKIINKIGARRYLEIGVAHAETFMAIDVDFRIGVDPDKPSQRLIDGLANVLAESFNRTDKMHIRCQIDHTDVSLSVKECSQLIYGNPRIKETGRKTSTDLFQLSSDDFFARGDDLIGPSGIDVAFVDGLHEWKQVVRDVDNCLRYLNRGGVIVMHDCCPTSALISVPPEKLEEARRSPKWNGAWTGDVWKAAAWLRSCRDDLNLFVLNCDWGVGIVTRGKPVNKLEFSYEELEEATFDRLDNDRQRILDLREPEFLEPFLSTLSQLGEKKTEPPALSSPPELKQSNAAVKLEAD